MNISEKMVSVLVELLAKSEVYYIPIRNWENGFRKHQYQAREAYERDGIRIGGGAAAERQQAADLRKRLAAAGLVKLVKRGKSAVNAGLILTERGELIARSACADPEMRDSRKWLSKIYKLRNSENGWDGGDGENWVSEFEVAGLTDEDAYADGMITDAARDKLRGLQFDLLPFTRRGWVMRTSDHDGRTWYAIVAAVGDPKTLKMPETPPDAPEYREEWIDEWGNAFTAEVGRLTETDPPNTNELGEIAASCSPPLRWVIAELNAKRRAELLSETAGATNA